MNKEQLNEAIKLDFQINTYEQIVKTITNEKAFPDAHFVMVKDNNPSSGTALPKEIEDDIVELIVNHVSKLKERFASI